jgi:hypothetical protein
MLQAGRRAYEIAWVVTKTKEYVVLPPGHHGARFLNLSKIDILKF